MAKSSLTKAELAILDALIADLQSDEIVESNSAAPLFITAIARTAVQAVKVTVKATPVVTQVVQAIGAASSLKEEEISSLAKEANNGLSLDKLIELRKKFH
ncbi:hypothetical protein ACFSR6_13290 [Pedobacter vanadiisoli]|uniref:Uncharacterized protein n=1 Tax=Pedobacter vanadiisoli TaxID=1761975 RepID=A0ABW5MKX8_9SPHI